MKKIILAIVCMLPVLASAQYTFDALQYSNTELRGSSRFMSMGGAFSALGGDLSTLNQNPGGLGVYRSSDIGITFGLDFISSKPEGVSATSQTKFLVNNVGYIGSLKLNSDGLRYFNWGFSYSRTNTFNRRYMGGLNNTPTSMTNFMADLATGEGVSAENLYMSNEYDQRPFNNTRYAYNVLGYNCGVILPTGDKHYSGLGINGATGYAEYEVDEWGETDEYNISLGGNIKDVLFWGMGVGISSMDYRYYNYYGEEMLNTEVLDNPGNVATIVEGNATYGLVNNSRTSGNGYNFKLGVILKPVNSLRIGFAFHTPTFYNMKDIWDANMSSEFYGDNIEKGSYTKKFSSPVNEYRYRIRTPWRFMGGIAAVIGGKGIISADYEYVNNLSIKICDDAGRIEPGSEDEMKTYLKPTHIIRLGAEYRIDKSWSVRAGFQRQTSQVQKDVENNNVFVVTSGYNPSYKFDKSTNYITCGVGYHFKNFYLDLAYVHKTRSSEYHAFSPIEYTDGGGNLAWDEGIYTGVKDNHNRLSCTFGFRF